MKLIYVDTSVFGGSFDSEFEFWSKLFFKQIIASETKIIISDVAHDELKDSPKHVQEFVNSIPKKTIVEGKLEIESIELAEEYLSKGVVGKSSRADCYHIAIATLMKADLLVSWNFKHIVNIDKIHSYNAINLLRGYKTLEIRSPRDIVNYEDED